MALASTLVVCCGGEAARGAGLRYAVIHLFGGALLMSCLQAGAASALSFNFSFSGSG